MITEQFLSDECFICNDDTYSKWIAKRAFINVHFIDDLSIVSIEVHGYCTNLDAIQSDTQLRKLLSALGGSLDE